MNKVKRKVIHEIKSLLHRWGEESDLDEEDLLKCVGEAIDEYFDEEVIDFDSDIELEEEE